MAIKPIEILIKARDEASSVFGSLQGKVAAVGAAIAGYFGISAFVGAVKGAADLEAKLSEVKAVSGATAAEMADLRKAAEDAGAATKYTATEGADALGNLTRAGLSAKDAIAALPAVLNLAQAGGVGLGEASEYVTKTVQGMGLTFADAGRVADVLAKGANASNASVAGLAQALSYTAPIANSLGLSLESTVAIIGKFSDAGIDASRAGTALNAILSQFADPSSKFQQELANAGIVTNNFEDALTQLAAAGPRGQQAILALGTEAGPAMRALLNQGIGAFADLKAALESAAGSAKATAAVMEDNLNGAFNSLSSSWDTVKNALATPVLPVLKEGVNQLADSLRGAVSSGTIGRFGDAIATAFQAGLKWSREFFGAIDLEALGVKLQAWAAQAGQAFTEFGQQAANAGNIVKVAYGVMSAGANVVLTAIYGLGLAFSETAAVIVRASAALSESLAKIAFGSAKQRLIDEAAQMREVLVGLAGVSEAFAARTLKAFDQAAVSAETAKEGFLGLTGAMAGVDKGAATSERVLQSMTETLKDVGTKAEEAGQKASASATKQRESADAARVAVSKLRAEYEAALAAGDWQLAAERMAALQRAAKGTAEQVTATRQAIEASGAALQAQMGLRQSSIQVSIEEQKAIAEVARALGNEHQALLAQQEVRRLEIELLRVTAEGKRAEAKTSIAMAEALRAELIARGELTQVKKLEIEATIAAAKVKENEAKIADLTADKLQTLADVSAQAGKAAAASRQGYDSAAAGLDRIAEASERAAAAERKRLNVDKSGFTLDANGNRLTMGGQLDIPEGYYFDIEAANKDRRFRSGMSDGKEFIKKKPETADKEELERRTALAESIAKDPGGYNGNAGYSPFGRQERQQATTRNVNITFNSQPVGKIKTDDEGEATVERLLNILAAAKRCST